MPPGADNPTAVRNLARALVLWALLPSMCAFGQNAEASTQLREYDVKAAFLLNFTRFVDWPPLPRARAAAPFAICIAGDDPFGDSLTRLIAGESVTRRPLVVKRPRGDFNGCQVLFIPASQSSQSAILAQAGPDVLTVGESSDFLRDGGMIRFVLEDRRVKFDINRAAVNKSMLKMSSHLLGAARMVLK